MPEVIVDVELPDGTYKEVRAPRARDAHYEAGKAYLDAKEHSKALQEYEKCRQLLKVDYVRALAK